MRSLRLLMLALALALCALAKDWVETELRPASELVETTDARETLAADGRAVWTAANVGWCDSVPASDWPPGTTRKYASHVRLAPGARSPAPYSFSHQLLVG
jgi:hypothetical protein